MSPGTAARPRAGLRQTGTGFVTPHRVGHVPRARNLRKETGPRNRAGAGPPMVRILEHPASGRCRVQLRRGWRLSEINWAGEAHFSRTKLPSFDSRSGRSCEQVLPNAAHQRPRSSGRKPAAGRGGRTRAKRFRSVTCTAKSCLRNGSISPLARGRCPLGSQRSV